MIFHTTAGHLLCGCHSAQPVSITVVDRRQIILNIVLPFICFQAIDIWMIICLLFVFASLIEYAIVNTLARRIARPIKQPRSSHVSGLGVHIGGPGPGGTGPRLGGGPGSLPRRDVEMGTPLQQVKVTCLSDINSIANNCYR